MFKKEGLKKGVPDMFLAIPTKRHPGMFIEFKSLKGKVSKEQKQWLGMLTSAGYLCVVPRTIDRVIKLTMQYLKEEI